VVDNEPSVCKAFERLLRLAKFDVVTFLSGTAFLSSLENRKPACVLLDLNMPGMSGFDVQARLAADPANRAAVIVVTAHDSIESQQSAMAGGAVAYFRKPVESKPLLEAIRAAVAAHPP
jgi:FixJ family two-component response regulator